MGKNPATLLRRFSVRQRMMAIVALLLLPLAVLSAVSMMVLNDQEMAFRDSVEESVHTLLPLTTLEYYLQQALVDELLAESHDSVPDFASLTRNIDNSFSSIQVAARGADVSKSAVQDARKAWVEARPSVRRLIEQVHTRHLSGAVPNTDARAELERAIHDISGARMHLSRVLKARYQQTAAERKSQLHWLMWIWLITLVVAGLLVMAFLRSLLRPVQALAQAASQIEDGRIGVRVEVEGRDELTLLAECFNRMTANWESTHTHLRIEATEDALTGVLNRRGILSSLEAELELHRQSGQPLSVLVMDLDRFKFINDHYGHSMGDRALKWIAENLRGMLREHDHLGRHGGDEFIAVLPATGQAEAQAIALRIHRTIGEVAARKEVYPGITLGVATLPDDGESASELLEAADARLYALKKRPPADEAGSGASE